MNESAETPGSDRMKISMRDGDVKMKSLKIGFVLFFIFLLAGCGSLQKKAALINVGDSKDMVLAKMGSPDDSQFRGHNEAWQYCQTGAGFGYHDYRIVWFYDGRVTAVTSYKSNRPGSSCMTDIRQINWEDAPDATFEIRKR